MNALGFGTGFRLNRRGGAGFDFSGGALPDGASLTRASVATRCDSSGAIANAAIDVPRFDYDPVSHAPRGLLVEPAATNLALNSQDWTQASWTRSSANIAATRLIESSSTAVMTAQMAVALTSGMPVTNSCIASEVAGSAKRYLCLTYAGAAFATQPFATFDLASGAVTASQNCTASIVAAPGGWLCAMTATPSATASATARFMVNASSTVANDVRTGDGTSAINASEAQIEMASAASSRVRSGSSAGARAADVLALAGPAGIWRFGFDDGSIQDVALTASGGVVTVPGNLARARIMRAALL